MRRSEFAWYGKWTKIKEGKAQAQMDISYSKSVYIS